MARPRERLCAFQRVELDAGESVEAEMTMGFDSLKMLDREMEWVIEPGDSRSRW